MTAFYDLDPEERGYWYDKAEQEHGVAFWDLSPEERGYYYDRAEGDTSGGGYVTYYDGDGGS